MIEWNLAQGGHAIFFCKRPRQPGSTPPNFEKACPPWAIAPPTRRRRRCHARNIGKKMQKNALEKCVIIIFIEPSDFDDNYGFFAKMVSGF
jgi:hypothetical protein